MSQPLATKIQRRTLLKVAPAAGLATLMRPEGSLGADAVRFAFFAIRPRRLPTRSSSTD